jgi:hypothetical protein
MTISLRRTAQAYESGRSATPTIRSVRRTTVIAAMAAVTALAGCGSSEPPSTPTACLAPASAYIDALANAPGEVRLADRTPISGCLVSEQQAGALSQVGSAMVAAATELNRRALDGASDQTAVELGYLVGAATEGASKTGGIHHDLILRLESAARYRGQGSKTLPSGFDAAYERGFAAGQSAG